MGPEMLNAIISGVTEEMLGNLAELVAVNSVNAPAKEGKPFGDGPAEALAVALKQAEKLGFKTVNMDNYCGYAEIGEGDEIIGIVTHLDVVPAGDGWDTDPFTMTRKGDHVYGRGVSDDKGAAVASMYAMKFLLESGATLNKRVRLIMGCNEETGSACMEYYKEHGEPVTAGFTPDGFFPGIHGEKGGAFLTAYSKNTNIISMNGGFVFNAVCDHCETVIPVGSVDTEALKAELAKTPLTAFTVTESDGKITACATGQTAHGSMPHLGVNAAGYTMLALKNAGMKDDFVEFYNSHIGITNDGAGLGIKCEDKYGDLTLSNGIVKTENGVISATLDVRFPVTFTADQIKEMLAPNMEDENGRVVLEFAGDPLFFPEDSKLVTDLYDAYVEVTGDTSHKPEVMGGGSYAKSVPGIIAFGCEFPGVENHIHEPNESLDINELKMQVAIYVKAIENLLR